MSWTDEDINYLKLNYNKYTDKELGIQLNKTTGSIGYMRNKLNLTKPNNISVDYTGKKIGCVTVISNSGEKTKQNDIIWNCITDDGVECKISSNNLKEGRCKWIRGIRPSNKNGMGRTRIYYIWTLMKQRCNNKNDKEYKYYGARGITYCKEWEDFQSFYEWAMSNGYDPNAPRGKCTLDRIDTDKDYCPENCRWVDFRTQVNNRRNYGKFPYYGLVENQGRYQVQLTENGKKVIIGKSRDINDVSHLLELRNKYIDEHNLPNKKNIFDPNIKLPALKKRVDS